MGIANEKLNLSVEWARPALQARYTWLFDREFAQANDNNAR